jgi:serine/threonine protein kinase
LKLKVPDTFGKYRRLYQLGQGVMGETYVASGVEGSYEERVAVKVCFPGVSRKLKGANTLENREIHARIPRYLMVEPGKDYECYLVTHYFNVKASHREAFPEQTLEEIVEFFIEAAEAVVALNEAGIYHGNLKPENIQVHKLGAEVHPIIVDTGLRYVYTPSFHDFAKLKKIIPYMAPEVTDVFLGDDPHAPLPNDGPSEVYGFVASFLHSFTGAAPFLQDDEASVDEILASKKSRDYQVVVKNDPTSTLDIRNLNALIERGLSHDPSARHPSMAALHDALVACLTPLVVEED